MATTQHSYQCRKGHTYRSPIRLTAVSCGQCNSTDKTKDNDNLMKEKKA